MMGETRVESIPLVVTRYRHRGDAYGPMEQITWGKLIGETADRRQGKKDGANLVFARFRPEQDGKAHRVKAKLLARTAIALDLESNKKTGEIPPPMAEALARAQSKGWAAILYTSHSHTPDAPRYRILLPISDEIPPGLPAVEVIAAELNLAGVLDESKLGAASLFYLPSAEPGKAADHETIVIEGAPIDAPWLENEALTVLEAREAAQAKLRAEALAEAEARRAAREKSGFKQSENLIEAIRDRLDLEGELLKHGYTKDGDRFLYPGSETGVPGVHILKGGDGVPRVYSHHSGDPLAACNLPSWCTVKAIDVVDLVTILDHGGDRKAALHKLAVQFGIESNPKAEAEPPADWDDIPPPDCEPEGQHAPRRKRMPPGTAAPAGETGFHWPEPVDFLTNENTPAPILAARHIPDALAGFVTDTAERMGVDPAAVALCGLVACAAAISDEWAVQPKRYDSKWTENARIWGAIVDDPSYLKTPIISAATRPFDTLEIEARKRHSEAMRQWKIDAAEAKQNNAAPPAHPKLERYMVEGTTPEALSEVLRDDDEAG